MGTSDGGEGLNSAGTSELHPEEMLTAARQGTLDARARRDLGAHLARCAACRLELALAKDIVTEGRPQTEDALLLDELVHRSLTEKTPAPLELRSGFGRSSTTVRRMVLPALCILLGGGVATGMWSVKHDFRRDPTIVELPTAREPVRHRAVAHPAPAPYLAPLNAEEEKDLAPRPAPSTAPAPERRAHSSHHRLLAAAAPTAPTMTPGDLFSEANRARRAGDYDAALTEYRKLSSDFPGSREAITGRMIVGELALTRHNPAEALKQFDGYLGISPNGTLAEEARVGRATALRALGRTDDERAAWQELLRKHPGSVHAQRARDRLNELR